LERLLSFLQTNETAKITLSEAAAVARCVA
jgi:hypothetical protein